MNPDFRLEQFGPLSQIVFCRPNGVNILTIDLLNDLLEAWYELEKGPTRVCIFRAEGKAFLAGADIKTMTDFDASQAREFADLGQTLFNAIENSGIVSVAAIHGACMGGGCELVLACDIRIGSPGIAIGQPEVNLGLIPGFGGTQRLPRIVGNGWASRMILSGEPLTDQQALQSSLVTELVPMQQLQSHVEKLAQTILTRGPQAVRLAKKLVKNSFSTKLSAGLEAEAYAFGNTFDSKEAREGTQAFIEKRLPRFEQRK